MKYLLAAALLGLGPTLALASPAPDGAHLGQGLIYGRVTTGDNATYEGRLRWGGDEEALWSNYFNGVKDRNPWAKYVAPEQLVRLRPIEIFGVNFGSRERRIDLERPLMVRFGDIARIDADGRDLTVTLRSGNVVELDRFEADDFADGLRVWDSQQGLVDLNEWPVRSVEFRPTPHLDDAPAPLHGTVHTALGPFTGLVQWDRESCLGSDVLTAHAGNRQENIRFDAVRTIWRHSEDSSRVLLRDGRELVLGGTRAAGYGNRGIYVDDPRYGRVLVSWDAFQRIEFGDARDGQIGRAPAYGDFPPGQPLAGRVSTRDGRRFEGRIVYDLDEIETTQTLDAPLQDVHFTILSGLIASIEVPDGEPSDEGYATVTLHSGERLQLERRDDLGADNAGLLVLGEGELEPRYVPWIAVEKLEFDRPSSMNPPLPATPEHRGSPHSEQ